MPATPGAQVDVRFCLIRVHVCSCSERLPASALLASALLPETVSKLPTRSRPRAEFCVQPASRRITWDTTISTVAARRLSRQEARSLCTADRGALTRHWALIHVEEIVSP